MLYKTLLAIALAAPLSAMAGALTIVNNTDQDSTSVINSGACSDILGDSGVTRAHTTNVVPENLVAKACIFNKVNCKAEIHMTSDCTGPVIATVVFDVKQGIKNIQPSPTPEGYVVSGSGFTAVLDTGATLKPWLRFFLGKK
jgi:hypothetical protein